jgi:hypothetical protein
LWKIEKIQSPVRSEIAGICRSSAELVQILLWFDKDTAPGALEMA